MQAVFVHAVSCVEGTQGGSLLIESREKKTIAKRISNKNANVQGLVSVDASAVPVSSEKTVNMTVSSAIGWYGVWLPAGVTMEMCDELRDR